MSKRTIYITHQEQTHRLAWYPGTSDDTIRDTIKETLGLPAEVGIVLKDDDNITYAVNQHLPSELSVRIEVRSRDNFYLDENIIRKDVASNYEKQGANQNTDSSGARQQSNALSAPNNASSVEFRGELLKFERINAHLANEVSNPRSTPPTPTNTRMSAENLAGLGAHRSLGPVLRLRLPHSVQQQQLYGRFHIHLGISLLLVRATDLLHRVASLWQGQNDPRPLF